MNESIHRWKFKENRVCHLDLKSIYSFPQFCDQSITKIHIKLAETLEQLKEEIADIQADF